MKSLEKNQDWQVAEVELVYKSKVSPSLRPGVGESKNAYEIFMKYWDLGKIEHIEQAKMIMLNKRQKVIAMYDLATGGIDGVIIDIRVIFSMALLTKASSLIMAHNHPSGNLMPSESDQIITNRIVKAGKLLQIEVLDHLIITNEGYFSFADKGLLE